MVQNNRKRVLAGLMTRSGGLLALTIPLMIYLAVGLLYDPPQARLALERQFKDSVPRSDDISRG